MSEEEKKSLERKASLQYYFSGLSESIDNKNVTTSVYFLKKITEMHNEKINEDRIVLILFSVVNFIALSANLYILFLK